MEDEKTTRVKKYEPTDSDFELNRISISYAENGVVIECGYSVKDEIKDKMRKQAQKMGVSCSFWEYENDSEKHVFQSKSEAKSFIIGELDEMWGGD